MRQAFCGSETIRADLRFGKSVGGGEKGGHFGGRKGASGAVTLWPFWPLQRAPHSSVFVFLVGSTLAPSFCVHADALGDGRRLSVDAEPGAPQGRWPRES
jgi:hypothetical protein